MLELRRAESQDVPYIAARFYRALSAADVPDDVVKSQGPGILERLTTDERSVAVVLHDPDNRNLLLGCAVAIPPLLLLVSLQSGLRPAYLDPLLRAAIGPTYDPQNHITAALPQPSWLLSCRKVYESAATLVTVHLLPDLRKP